MSAEPSRERGFDLARAFAIVMMVMINFQLMLAASPGPGDSPWSRALRWLVHVPSGRSSSLFVVLAGVGVTLLTRRARSVAPDAKSAWILRAAASRTLLLRAIFLLGAGLLLYQVWWIDILHFYACYLTVAALALWWAPDLLLASFWALTVIAGGVLSWLAIDWPDLPLLSPLGFVVDVLVDGVHPMVPWLAFLTYGVWLGRRDLSAAGTRARFALGAAAVFLACELGSLALTVLVLSAPPLAFLEPHLGVFGTGWTPEPLYVVSACATATLFITIAHQLMASPAIAASRVTLAAIAAGQMALTIYVTHAVFGVVVPRNLFGWWNGLPVEVVTAWWAAFCLSVIAGAAVWRRFFSRGPLEWVMRGLTSWELPRERAIEVSAPPRPAPPAVPSRSIPIAALLAALGLVLLSVRLVGVPLPAGEGPGRRGVLSLLHQRDEHVLVIERPCAVVLQTHSGLDLYLELDRQDGAGFTRVAEDDDGGEGTEARIETTLAPGTYRIAVRPYGAVTGPYVLDVVTSPR